MTDPFEPDEEEHPLLRLVRNLVESDKKKEEPRKSSQVWGPVEYRKQNPGELLAEFLALPALMQRLSSVMQKTSRADVAKLCGELPALNHERLPALPVISMLYTAMISVAGELDPKSIEVPASFASLVGIRELMGLLTNANYAAVATSQVDNIVSICLQEFLEMEAISELLSNDNFKLMLATLSLNLFVSGILAERISNMGYPMQQEITSLLKDEETDGKEQGAG